MNFKPGPLEVPPLNELARAGMPVALWTRMLSARALLTDRQRPPRLCEHLAGEEPPSAGMYFAHVTAPLWVTCDVCLVTLVQSLNLASGALCDVCADRGDVYLFGEDFDAAGLVTHDGAGGVVGLFGVLRLFVNLCSGCGRSGGLRPAADLPQAGAGGYL